MRVLVLPGGSSPYSSNKYRRSYTGIAEALSSSRPGVDVDLVLYPGQVDEHGDGFGDLTIGSAADHVLEVIGDVGTADTRMLCICFGAVVGANVLRRAPGAASKVCFYGPLPYWKLAATDYLSDPSWTDGARGVRATAAITSGGSPIEDLVGLALAPHVKIAIGLADAVVLPETLDYFKSLVGHRAAREYARVLGAPHTVSEVDDGWPEFVSQCIDWVTAPIE